LQTLLDILVLSAAHALAFLIRFEGTPPQGQLDVLLLSLPCVLLVQYLSLVIFEVPDLAWRFVSLFEVRRIVVALTTANVLLFGTVWILDRCSWDGRGSQLTALPRGVILIDLLLGLVGVIGLRAATRLWLERRARVGRDAVQVPTLFIGAGQAGAEVARAIVNQPQLGIQPVGFLDDDPAKTDSVIHGVRVLGPVTDVARLAQVHGAKQALITIGRPSGEHVRRILDLCKRCGVQPKIIPGLPYILEGRANLSAIREVAIEDLLHREPVQLDVDAIAAFVNSRKVLISGAGGSIGSELCRTVCRFGPARLILVEHTENNLFHIHGELLRTFPDIDVLPCLADICDSARMERIFASTRPDMVLHAAAYKHVPMIEWNPGEAIKNNVLGTRALADVAAAAGVSEFVMISTDKAVNPTSVMGVSKRIAEIYIQALSQRSRTRFVTVRFGNVLGSAGSVLPTFKEQMARGGPITVTHPEMKRYFMTIPEASQLVLQAATLGCGGEIFILDMGEPVKIVDLARDLIRLSGLSSEDIEIRFTGLRPGEKLFEELALKDEVARKTTHPKIFIGRLRPCKWEEINRAIEDLSVLADSAEPQSILRQLKRIVPEYEVSMPAPREMPHIRTDAEHPLPVPTILSLPTVNGLAQHA
jgi:FlaA1/EpsC-like NDP-sugar epimerase